MATKIKIFKFSNCGTHSAKEREQVEQDINQFLLSLPGTANPSISTSSSDNTTIVVIQYLDL